MQKCYDSSNDVMLILLITLIMSSHLIVRTIAWLL